MSSLRKRKKLSTVQLFTLTQAVYTSSLILLTYVKLRNSGNPPLVTEPESHVKNARP